jgi:tRNA (Thr-GGU) A37 N-methylase
MHATLRRIATVVEETCDSAVIELCKPLNADAFDGIMEWSHCWVIVLHSLELKLHLFSIAQTEKRKIFLTKKIHSQQFIFCNNSIVVDIKPVHALDLV